MNPAPPSPPLKKPAWAGHTYRVADVGADIVELGAIFCVHGAPEMVNRDLVHGAQ